MRLDRVYQCAQCEYELTGLQEIGRCPECGSVYHVPKGVGILESSWVHGKPQRSLAAWLRCLFAAGLLVLVGLLMAVVLGDATALWVTGAVALILCLAAARQYRESP